MTESLHSNVKMILLLTSCLLFIGLACGQIDNASPMMLGPMRRLDLFEGDIMGVDLDNYRHAVYNEHRWTDGIVYYNISDVFDDEARQTILDGLRKIEEETCIRFVPWNGEPDFIDYFSGGGCWSFVGRLGGRQQISLQKDGCVAHYIVVHETMHALGFWHEQSRADRDNYVTIHWENIWPGTEHNFKKHSLDRIQHLAGYDFGSVMHYTDDSFVKEWHLKSITSKYPGYFLGNFDGMTPTDIFKLNKLYDCDIHH